MRKLLLLAGALALAGCRDSGGEPVPPEVAAARRDAARYACLGDELARGADDDLQTLEGVTGAGDDVPAVVRQAREAAAAYGRAFAQHAQLRAAVYAYADSALNHARADADSARYAERAERLRIRAPEPGTLEANVLQDYNRRLGALLADQDHPCNWDLEAEQQR